MDDRTVDSSMHRPRLSKRLFVWAFLLSSTLLPYALPRQVSPPGFGAIAEKGFSPFHLAGMEQRLAAQVERCGGAEEIGQRIRCCLYESLINVDRPVEVEAKEQEQPSEVSSDPCLALLNQENDLFGKAMYLSSQARREKNNGRVAQAVELYEVALTTLDNLKRLDAPIHPASLVLFLEISALGDGLVDQVTPMLGMVGPLFVGFMESLIQDNYAMMLLEEGDLEGSEALLERALETSQPLFGLLDAQILDHLGRVQVAREDWEQARDFFDRALGAARRLGDRERQYGLLHRLAGVELARGNPTAAIPHLEEALELARLHQDYSEETRAQAELSQVYSLQGQGDEAREAASRAVLAAQASDDLESFLWAKIASATHAFSEGAYSQAIRDLEHALKVIEGAETMAYPGPEVAALTLLAKAYDHMGQSELAATKFEAAQALIDTGSLPELEVYMDLASALLSGETPSPERWDSLQSALEGLNRSPDATDQFFGKNFGPLLGLVPQINSLDIDVDPAPWQEKAAGSTLPFVRGMGLLSEAMTAFEQEDFAQALQRASEAEVYLRRSGVREMHAAAKLLVAAFRWKTGDREQAADEIEAGIELFDGVTREIQSPDLLSMFMGSQSRVSFYEVGVKFLAEMGRVETAFDIAERARARALFESLGPQSRGLSSLSEDLRTRLENQREEILELSENKAPESEIVRSMQIYRRFLVEADLEAPVEASQVETELPRLETLQSEYLDAETTLVSYFILGDQAWIWIIDREQVKMVQVEIDKALLKLPVTLVSRNGWRQSWLQQNQRKQGQKQGHQKQGRGVRRINSEVSGEPSSRELYDALWKPIAEYVRTPKVVVIPHRELHYLPFVALQDANGNFLAQELKISYAPSAGIWGRSMRKPGEFMGRVLVLGDPSTDHKRLRGARVEARRVADLFGDQPLIGEEATESRVWQGQGKIDLLHLAAHGIHLSKTPRFSHVALTADAGHDGRLEIDELFLELDLSGVDLVTLSACHTSWGEHTRADEVFSLSRGFLHAGSPAVLATLWQVDDAATAFWMRSFYRRLLSGASYTEAVHGAQLDTRGRPDWAAPHYWAGFVLIGDPHRRWQESEAASGGAILDVGTIPEM